MVQQCVMMAIVISFWDIQIQKAIPKHHQEVPVA